MFILNIPSKLLPYIFLALLAKFYPNGALVDSPSSTPSSRMKTNYLNWKLAERKSSCQVSRWRSYEKWFFVKNLQNWWGIKKNFSWTKYSHRICKRHNQTQKKALCARLRKKSSTVFNSLMNHFLGAMGNLLVSCWEEKPFVLRFHHETSFSFPRLKNYVCPSVVMSFT